MELTRRNFMGLVAGAVASAAAGSTAFAATQNQETAPFTYTSEDFFLDYGDYKTHARLRKPDLAEGQTCPAVLFAHGFTGTMENPVHTQICEALAARGVAALQIDYTDLGQSDMPFVDHSVLTDVDQALIAIDYLRGLDWVDKVGMMGHSQGGCGTCFTAAALEDEGKPLDFAILLAPANMIPDVARLGGYEAVDDWYAGMGMFFDPDHEPDVDDILEGTGTKFNYFKVMQPYDMWEVCQKVSCPTLLVWGTLDRPIALNIAVRTFENIPNCTFVPLEGEDHSLANRTDDIIDRINRFLDGVLA